MKIKDINQYIEPFITILVKGNYYLRMFYVYSSSSHPPSLLIFYFKDENGLDLAPPMNTPIAVFKDDHIFFNVDVFLQVPLERIGKG